MLRVAVIGGDSADWSSVSARVRHARVGPSAADPADPAWQSADAIAFVGSGMPGIDIAEAALTDGKHLLWAAPSPLEAGTIQRWIESARARRVQLDVVNPQRARPSRRLIRQHIENAKLGDVGLVRINRSVPAASTDDGETPAARLEAALIGDVDLAVWLTGRTPDTVFAVRRPVETDSADHPEILHVHLGFQQGGMALLTSTSAGDGTDEYESLSVIAFSGAAYADDHQNRQLLFGNGPATALRAEEGDTLAFLIEEFALSVKGETDPEALLSHWRRIEAIAEAVERSAASRQAIGLELD